MIYLDTNYFNRTKYIKELLFFLLKEENLLNIEEYLNILLASQFKKQN